LIAEPKFSLHYESAPEAGGTLVQWKAGSPKSGDIADAFNRMGIKYHAVPERGIHIALMRDIIFNPMRRAARSGIAHEADCVNFHPVEDSEGIFHIPFDAMMKAAGARTGTSTTINHKPRAAAKRPAARKEQTTMTRDEADQKLDAMTKQRAASRGIKYSEAFDQIRAENPELYQIYLGNVEA